ncbi:hypothetical protein D3C77_489960 [compost metagenome]
MHFNNADMNVDNLTSVTPRRSAPNKIVLVVDFKGFYPLEKASTAVSKIRTAIKTAAFKGTSTIIGHWLPT